MCKIFLTLLLFLFTFTHPLGVQAITADSYFEDFDDRIDESTVDEVDSWSVDQGENNNARTQDRTAYDDVGNSLEIRGAGTPVSVTRSSTYGNITPCWVEFFINPGLGSQERSVPTGKIAALTFDYTGKVYASNGSSWEDTGVTFNTGEWYRVILKVDFDDHLYDVYIEPTAEPEAQFIADKTDLAFIDTSIDSLSQISLDGVYSTIRDDDTYIDNLCVYFVDRLEVTTALQTLREDTPSEAITVQLQNAYSEPQTAWTDFYVDLKSTSATGQFSLSKTDWSSVSQVIIPDDAQEVTFYYKDSSQGTPVITATEYPDRGWDEASQEIEIAAEVASFNVAATTPQVAGQAFNVTITANNDEGEVDKLYAGEVSLLTEYISPSSGNLSISPSSVTEFTDGMAQLAIQYPDSGTIEIVVQDVADSTKTGSSGEILVTPAAFAASADSSQVVNKTFSLKVSALNAQGEVTPNYQGPVSLSVVAVSPEETSGTISLTSLSSDDFSAGIADRNLAYNRWGTIKIKAYDTVYSDKTGISETISFMPNRLLVEAEASSADRNFYYVGESIEIMLSALDINDEVITNYQGSVDISTTLGLSLAEEYQFVASDQGKHSFVTSASSAGFYDASFEDKGAALTAEFSQIQVKNAILQVISSVATIGTTEVTVQLTDDDGNIIATENDLSVQVILEEEYENSSASSSATDAPTIFKNGVAKILITDNQPETVIISPSSEYDFTVKKGTVTFGRIAKTGIGALMWREIKD